MPFICLTRNDIPDGTIQILDLKPNTSQRVPSMDAPGQTRYVNRVLRDPVEFDASGDLVFEAKGLVAYLADRVQPGGLQQAHAHITSTLPVDGDTVDIAGVTFTCVDNFATGSVQMNTPAVDDTVTIAGVLFTAKAAQNIPALQFDQSGAVGAQAISLAAVINGAAAQAAFLAANPAVGIRPAMSVSAIAVGDTVNLTCTIRGIDGDALTLAKVEAAPGTIVLSGATFDWVAAVAAAAEFQGYLGVAAHTDDQVATSLAAAVAACQAAIIAAIAHAGETITAAAALHVVTLTYSVAGAFGLVPALTTSTNARLPITTTLTGHLGFTVQVPTKAQYTTVANGLVARLDAGQPLALANINTVLTTTFGSTGLTTGGSTGTVLDVLSILAGREYLLPMLASKFPSDVWDSTVLGSFTHTNPSFGTTMIAGEWKPSTMPFDPVAVENKPIRATFDGSSFQISITSGALSKFAAGVTLFPDSDLEQFHVSQHQKSQPYPQVNGARLVTVFADDGTVLV